MKDLVTLQAETRDGLGKGAARQLRREGLVPAVVYGHGRTTSSLSVKADELEMMLAHISASSTVIELTVGSGESRKVLIREIQRHPFRSEVLHVDFLLIREDQVIRVEIPLHLTGQAVGSTEGGILQQQRHEIAIECLPGDIPEAFDLDISELAIGDALYVADIDGGNVTVVDDPEVMVAIVQPPALVVEEEEEEVEGEVEDMEPEVIGKGKAESADDEDSEDSED
jgi:large subunit ribosomal protein L25